MVASLDRHPRDGRVTRSRSTTGASTCPSTSPSRWSGTSWASSPPRVRSARTVAATERHEGQVDGTKDRTRRSGGHRDRPLHPDVADQGPPGGRPHPRSSRGRCAPGPARSRQRGATMPVRKVLESAIANAEHNRSLPADELVVARAWVDEGPTLRRFRPRAMGRATRISKRTCHISVVVGRPEEVEPAERPTRKTDASQDVVAGQEDRPRRRRLPRRRPPRRPLPRRPRAKKTTAKKTTAKKTTAKKTTAKKTTSKKKEGEST